MKNIIDYKIILWDFDGVIMDSMPIRSKGFEEVLKDYPKEQVDNLLEFHNTNGGLSRYVKFRHFFENIRNESIEDEEVLALADNFSKIMLSLLIDEKLLIEDSVNFIRENWMNHEMHIVSGSDGKELAQICEGLDLSKYFRSINGSPTPKKELVRRLLVENNYNKDNVTLIGDSINDKEASLINEIGFCGYNNESLKEAGTNYIEQLSLSKN
ncbi:Phosphoglycolate phosphatase, HAD superfamily [Pseudarcicella hirudinis]|uniref:phosphoglycolate phosphatase n=1 Tax=Pseudarcicella hirudinis TaxID=1079859 RepID=A0A1I5YNT6_9BACT|nr:HAD hydrolase-like protein [Pseudarcicella hirudinis]SFQ45904.1 Phosphoglycolate phosphatase, HAD superfamily [Pseudarcicella hirudinis]